MSVLNHDLKFPDPRKTDRDGLLAVGGDLSSERLLLAYRSGIFPWFSDAGIIHWFCPPQRMVLFPGELKISRSMKKILNAGKFSVTEDRAFEAVIQNCAHQHTLTKGGTWIDDDFISAYTRLYQLGHAHSIEVWFEGKLAGGLYGIAIGKMICGESMFSIVDNASKIAIIHLCRNKNYSMLDCQVPTAHLQRLGAKVISREEFLEWVEKLRN
jgi:leucyl/phenylalanyl-tRNA--protein transferase